MTAPVYKEGTSVAVKERNELWEIIHSLKDSIPADLYNSLCWSMTRVDEALKASVPIARGGRIGAEVGVGLNKAQKAIACDQLISIAKQIKALKAW